MEGSDFVPEIAGMQNSLVTPRVRRVPKIGETVIVRGGRDFLEGIITQIAHDRDNEPSRAKFEWRGLFGRKRHTWVWIFDLYYPTTSKPDVG